MEWRINETISRVKQGVKLRLRKVVELTLKEYDLDINEFSFDEVKKNYFEGYENIRSLPEFSEFDLELILVARRLNFMNYILLVSDNPKEYVERNLKWVIEFMDKFQIHI